MLQRRSFFVLCGCGVLAVACGGPTFIVQQYDGPPRSPETIAILRVHGRDTVQLLTLDGSRADAVVDDDVRLHIEVLPGAHTLHVLDRQNEALGPHRIAFRATPGAVYRIVFARSAEVTTRARIYEVSAESDALLRDVTLAGSDEALRQPLPPP